MYLNLNVIRNSKDILYLLCMYVSTKYSTYAFCFRKIKR